VTGRVPVVDMVRVKRRLLVSDTRLIGPNSQGIITPEQCKIGIMPGHIHFPGKIGIASRSASLTYEAVGQCGRARLGQSSVIGIGGDPVYGLGFVECLELLLRDPETEGILLIGEIGGTAEEEAAAFITAEKPKKPIAAYVAGLRAETGRPAWSDSLGASRGRASVAELISIRGAPVIDEGRVFGIGLGGLAAAIDLPTGRRLWERQVAGQDAPHQQHSSVDRQPGVSVGHEDPLGAGKA